MALSPEERAKAEEMARIQTNTQWKKGMGFIGFQLKVIGIGLLLVVGLFVLSMCGMFFHH